MSMNQAMRELARVLLHEGDNRIISSRKTVQGQIGGAVANLSALQLQIDDLQAQIDALAEVAAAVAFTASDMNTAGGWISGNNLGDEPARYSLDRDRVTIEGLVTKTGSNMTLGDLIMTVPLAIRPVGAVRGFLLIDTVIQPIQMGSAGTMTYVGASYANPIGAQIHLTYRLS